MSASMAMYGNRELDAAFRRMERVDQRRGFNKAARDSMRPMLELARRLAPRHLGILARKIQLRKAKGRGVWGAEIRFATRAAFGIPENAKGFYPIQVELGTKFRAATPFLRPAFDTLYEPTAHRFMDRIWSFIEGAWGR